MQLEALLSTNLPFLMMWANTGLCGQILGLGKYGIIIGKCWITAITARATIPSVNMKHELPREALLSTKSAVSEDVGGENGLLGKKSIIWANRPLLYRSYYTFKIGQQNGII